MAAIVAATEEMAESSASLAAERGDRPPPPGAWPPRARHCTVARVAKAKRRRTGLAGSWRATRPRVPVLTLLRMFVLGAVSVIASIYALVRHLTREPEPMIVPAPPSTEIPAPELVPLEAR